MSKQAGRQEGRGLLYINIRCGVLTYVVLVFMFVAFILAVVDKLVERGGGGS